MPAPRRAISAAEGDGTIATHYQAIGFQAETLEALEELVIEAATRARHIALREGRDFAVWEDESGAALWIQMREGAIVGAHPFYAAAAPHTARIEAAAEDEDDPMDGRVRLYILPEQTVLLPVDVVNWPLVSHTLRQQTTKNLCLAAFAESITVWENLDAYTAARPESRRQGARWIVPTGLYPEEKGGTGRATANITGIVTYAETRVNGLTGATFRHICVDTTGCEMDIVAEDGPLPPVGGIARGHFWLAGLFEVAPGDSLLRIQGRAAST